MTTQATVATGGVAVRPSSVPTMIGLCFVEARLQVQAIFLARLYIGAVLALPAGAVLPAGRMAAVAIVWELTIAAVYLFDGVMDVVEDRLNGSRRPIARGALPRGFALGATITMAAAALAGAYLLGPAYVIMVGSVLTLGYIYGAPPLRLKRWSGSAGVIVTVAGLVTFAAGAGVAGHQSIHVTPALVVFALTMSLWMGVVGALAKDFSDLEGDAVAQCHTTVVVNYLRAVRMVVINPLVVATGMALLATWYAPVLTWPALVMAIGAGAIAVAALGMSPKAARARRRLPYNFYMLTQFAVHVAVVVVTL